MSSSYFSSVPRDYLHMLAMAWLSRYWMIVALPLVLVCVWTLFDLRAIYVGLITILILYPFALTLVWFNYAFSPHTLRAVTPHFISIEDDGFTLTYLPLNDSDSPRFPPEHFDWKDIHAVEHTGKNTVIILGRSIDQRLLIPADVLDTEDSRLFLSKISGKLPSVDI